jgi:ribose-5-phosphate isomerase
MVSAPRHPPRPAGGGRGVRLAAGGRLPGVPGAEVSLRRAADGSLFRTDQGNLTLDADFGPIDDPATLAGRLLARAGVAEVGLFCGLTSDLIIATRAGVEHRRSHDKEQR